MINFYSFIFTLFLPEIYSNFTFANNVGAPEYSSWCSLLAAATIPWYGGVAPPPCSSSPRCDEGGSVRCRKEDFRGGYHCRCREIGRKMGNPAAWWQMVDHRERERAALLAPPAPALRGRRQGMGRIRRGHWAGTRDYMDAKLGDVRRGCGIARCDLANFAIAFDNVRCARKFFFFIRANAYDSLRIRCRKQIRTHGTS